MIEFLCKVEFPASPRTSRVPVRQNQVWQNVPSESPFEKDFKYSSTAPAQHNLSLKSLLVGILQICHQSSRPALRFNSPSECLQTPQVGLERKPFLRILPNQMELIRAVETLSKLGEGRISISLIFQIQRRRLIEGFLRKLRRVGDICDAGGRKEGRG